MSRLKEIAPLTIIADDLTGALDTAGPFASASIAIPVVTDVLQIEVGSEGGVAISTESRDLAVPAATAAAEAAARMRVKRVGRGGLWFKKVDSVLRGHPFDETLAIADAAGIERIVVAPAFPEQGRRTVGGRQEARTAEGWVQVGEDLIAAFETRGVPAVPWSPGALWPPARVAVVDAGSSFDLDRIAAQLFPALAAEPTLVVGCGGLAEAMAGRPPPHACAMPDLLLIGSPHPVMQEQVRQAQAAVSLPLFEAGAEAGAPPPLGKRPLCVVPGAGIQTKAAADRALVIALERMVARGDAPRRIFVSGGATLSLVAIATGSRGIVCTGRFEPGLPSSRLIGGAWDGCEVTSKSGGFGQSDLLALLLQNRRNT